MRGPKKPVEVIEQPITLEPGVTVLIRYEAKKQPHIAWNGGTVTITAGGMRVPVWTPAERTLGEPMPTSNGPEFDTPEIQELKRRLALGAAVEPKPVTTADVFEEMGLGGGASELEAAIVGGAVV